MALTRAPAAYRVQGIIARNSLQNGIILNNGTTNNATAAEPISP